MNNRAGYLALAVALLGLGITLFRAPSGSDAGQAKKETAFERVMRTHTLRCAYALWQPHFVFDSNTKHMSGETYEIMEAIGKALNLKIEWAEEVGYGAFPENLRSGKQDAFCSGTWQSVPRATRVEYATPVEYTPLYVFVREGDMRFDNNRESLNDEKITFSVIDGASQKAATDALFPKSKQYSLGGDSDASQELVAVAQGKADAVVANDDLVDDYNAHNPQARLRRVPSKAPLRTFGLGFAVAKGEWELRDLLNVAIRELQINGTLENILSKNEAAPGRILRAAPVYVLPKED